PDEDHLRVWALSHGLPGQVGEVPWHRQAVLDAAGHVPESARLLDALIAMGLVVEVSPGTPGAADFARTHRMRPLLTGLGNSPDDPLRFAIGLIGTPVVKVESSVFEMWQWGRLGSSLWDTADMFFKVDQASKVDQAMSDAARSGRTTDGGTESVLTDILERLHLLLGYNAAYLDLALTRPTDELI
ncbi:MAG: hypothetical protein ACRDUA_06115, partial [Micromonosporaceae bacterium]